MLLSDILKLDIGLFSKDVNSRIKNGQIRLNGNSINKDIEMPNLQRDRSGKLMIIDAGSFIFNIIRKNPSWIDKMKIFGFENLFDTNIDNDLTDFLSEFIFLKISRKEFFIVKKI
jgi:hypothetical protein